MFEPHLQSYEGPTSNDTSLMAELDRIAPIKSFDAFPKVQSTYTSQSRRGGVLTALVGSLIFLLVLNDLGEYLYGAPDYSFKVDHEVDKTFQLNVDLTIAMPCHCYHPNRDLVLSIDLRDAVGDRLHLSDYFIKDGTTFTVGKATSSKLAKPTLIGATQIINASKRRTPNQRGSLSGIRRLFGPSEPKRLRKQHTGYRPTANKIEDGPACRIYGSTQVKKVTANLHITTLGHGYMSAEHTDHTLMNTSHVIHEFSFGPFFPAISQPLDMTVDVTEQPFTIFQYFLRVVPTTYVDAHRRRLVTSQYAVTDYTRSFEHGKGIPGIFFKYDLEAMALTIREQTTSLYQFLLRLVGVIGGVWTVAAFGLRIFNRAQKQVLRAVSDKTEYIPSSMSTPLAGALDGNEGYFQNGTRSDDHRRLSIWSSN